MYATGSGRVLRLPCTSKCCDHWFSSINGLKKHIRVQHSGELGHTESSSEDSDSASNSRSGLRPSLSTHSHAPISIPSSPKTEDFQPPSPGRWPQSSPHNTASSFPASTPDDEPQPFHHSLEIPGLDGGHLPSLVLTNTPLSNHITSSSQDALPHSDAPSYHYNQLESIDRESDVDCRSLPSILHLNYENDSSHMPDTPHLFPLSPDIERHPFSPLPDVEPYLFPLSLHNSGSESSHLPSPNIEPHLFPLSPDNSGAESSHFPSPIDSPLCDRIPLSPYPLDMTDYHYNPLGSVGDRDSDVGRQPSPSASHPDAVNQAGDRARTTRVYNPYINGM
jgi:hypothetical protein